MILKEDEFLQLLHVILAKLWIHVLVIKLNETCYFVQIYILLLFEAQMVGLNTTFGCCKSF
jgi:hypothetical protein